MRNESKKKLLQIKLSTIKYYRKIKENNNFNAELDKIKLFVSDYPDDSEFYNYNDRYFYIVKDTGEILDDILLKELLNSIGMDCKFEETKDNVYNLSIKKIENINKKAL